MTKSSRARVRIAPSPTGFAHVGTAYTALFNYAFARQNQGQFILRIEDTDAKRHVAAAEKAITKSLKWLGLVYDEGPDIGGPFGPYRQSERLKVYRKYAQKLLNHGEAYPDEGAIRFQVPAGKTVWQDLIRGEVIWENEQIKDFVILKSDHFPTYNFACAVDDFLMKISHVIRAEEHLANTPRQLLLYQAFGAKPPQFAHLPLLRNPDHSKISKRKNPVALDWYQKQGYLSQALVNFFCLLGWSHPEGKDVFPLEEFVKHFSFSRISTSAPIFDLKKLAWLNGVYIRQKTDQALLQLLKPFAPQGMKTDLIKKTIPLVKERLSLLSDYPDLVDFLMKKPKVKKMPLAKKQLTVSYEALAKSKTWEAEALEEICRALAEKNRWPIGKYFMNLRLALTGKKVTPPLFASMSLLGRAKTLARLKSAF